MAGGQQFQSKSFVENFIVASADSSSRKSGGTERTFICGSLRAARSVCYMPTQV